MKIDKFTKIILAIIAFNLTILTLKNLDIIPSVYADSPKNNYVTGLGKNYGLVPINEDGSVTVKLNTETIDVNIKDIDTYSSLPIKIESINTFHTFPVELKNSSITVKEY